MMLLIQKRKGTGSQLLSKLQNSCWYFSFQEATFLDTVFYRNMNEYYILQHCTLFSFSRNSKPLTLVETLSTFFSISLLCWRIFSARSLSIADASVFSSSSLSGAGEAEGDRGAGTAELSSDWLDRRSWAIKETPTGLGGRRSEDSENIFTGEEAKYAQSRSHSSSCRISFLLANPKLLNKMCKGLAGLPASCLRR